MAAFLFIRVFGLPQFYHINIYHTCSSNKQWMSVVNFS